ncbi:MAG: hypothetical protein WC436_05600 [Candidatus Babeliales bacterium]
MNRKLLDQINIEKIRIAFQKKKLSCKPFSQDLDKWNAACVALDTMEDALMAILAYGTAKESRSVGLRYLKLYGLLQAVFLQQDAIQCFLNVLGGNFEKEKKRLIAWHELRNLRNLTVGHPVDNFGEKRCYIIRVSIAKHGFECIMWDKKKRKDDFVKIDIKSLLNKYRKEVGGVLRKVQDYL